jgi:hypothetical protein
MYAGVFRCASVIRVLIGGLHGHKCGIVVDQGDEHVREQGGAVAYVHVGSERSGGLAHRCASQRLPTAQQLVIDLRDIFPNLEHASVVGQVFADHGKLCLGIPPLWRWPARV